MSKPSPYNPPRSRAKGDKDIPKGMTIEVGTTCYLKGGSGMLTVVDVNNNDLTVCWVAYGPGAYHIITLPVACFHKFQRVASE